MTEQVCPRCGETYTGFPALSRTDNKTSICSDCGNAEAMEDFLGLPLTPLKSLTTNSDEGSCCQDHIYDSYCPCCIGECDKCRDQEED
jgi:predicted RNA-binding Zn-ribbon protein involved in translation (DUF1610 family)